MIKVTLDNQKTVEVSKLPIKRYAELLKALRQLPRHFEVLQNLSNDQMFTVLPEILTESLPEALNILNIATSMDIEELETLGLNEIVDLFGAVITVNKYVEVYSKIKKAIPHQAQMSQA